MVGDTIQISGHTFIVCGTGTVPDYDTPLRNLSDSAVDSSRFGIGFVISSDYEAMKAEQLSIQTEEYVYAYLLGENVTDQELKETLQEFSVAAEDIDDMYFREYWERTGGKLEKLKDNLQALEKIVPGIFGEVSEYAEEYLDTDLPKLTQFLPARDNTRIGGAADDVMMVFCMGMLFYTGKKHK